MSRSIKLLSGFRSANWRTLVRSVLYSTKIAKANVVKQYTIVFIITLSN